MDDAAVTIKLTGAGVVVVAGAAVVLAPPAAVPIGVLGAAVGLMGEILDHLAGDPPQPFEQVVTFGPRISRFAKTADPALERLGVVGQYSISAVVTGQGYLDALERLAGAQQAEDLSWAVTHWGVVQQCRDAFAVDLANVAAALFAAAQALKKSTLDLPLDSGGDNLRDWLESPGVERTMARDLTEMGLLPSEVQSTFKLLKSNPVYEGSAPTLSAELEQSSRKIHSCAQKLFA